MESTDLTKEELLKEVRRLRKNIGGRIKKIDALNIDLNRSASKDFKKFLQTYKNIGKDTTEKELRSAYRDLKYIDQLKTSTVKGAKKAYEDFKDVEGLVNILSPGKQKEFWDVYQKLYEVSGGMAERFKYDVFSEVINAEIQGVDMEELALKITELYEKVYERTKFGNGTDDELELRFTKSLGKFLEFYI